MSEFGGWGSKRVFNQGQGNRKHEGDFIWMGEFKGYHIGRWVKGYRDIIAGGKSF